VACCARRMRCEIHLNAARARACQGFRRDPDGGYVKDSAIFPCLFNHLEVRPLHRANPISESSPTGEFSMSGCLCLHCRRQRSTRPADANALEAIEVLDAAASVSAFPRHAVHSGVPQVWPDHSATVLFDDVPSATRKLTEAAFAQARAVLEISISIALHQPLS